MDACAQYSRTGTPVGPSLESPLIAFGSTSGIVVPDGGVPACATPPGIDACAAVDLTAAYAGQGVAGVTRNITLSGGRTVLAVSDRWTLGGSGAAPQNVTWVAHTRANVTLIPGGAGLILESPGAPLPITVTVEPHSPCAGGSVRYAAVVPSVSPPESPITGVTRMEIWADPRECGGLDVVIAPHY
jgi:hypothetical protein